MAKKRDTHNNAPGYDTRLLKEEKKTESWRGIC